MNRGALAQAVPVIPRVSCILPVYNGERFLEEAIDSILCQTFADFELLIVNDGSIDKTGDILARYADRDSRVQVLTQPNEGIVSALNAGLSVSRGEYVARMDADDISKPGRFAFQVQFLDDNVGCVLVGGSADKISSDDAVAEIGKGRTHRSTDLSCFPPKVTLALHPLIMMRSAPLKQIGGYRSGYPHAEDYDLFLRLAAHGTIENPREVILTYRRHAEAVSIKHVEVQERSAALAEVDARDAAGFAPLPDWMIESYVRFRIWRRYRGIAPDKARTMNGRQTLDVLNLSPRVLSSAPYWRLRLLIAANLFRALRSQVLGECN